VRAVLRETRISHEAPSFVTFLTEVLAGATPLLVPPLLAWGGLACGLLEPSGAAFALAALLAVHAHAFGCPAANGSPRAGPQELRLMAGATLLLPALTHAVVHFQLLAGPSGSALSALAAVVSSDGASGHVAVLDEVQAVVLWELLLLLTGERTGGYITCACNTKSGGAGGLLCVVCGVLLPTPPPSPNRCILKAASSLWCGSTRRAA